MAIIGEKSIEEMRKIGNLKGARIGSVTEITN
jgi:hypothetical protein